MRINKNMKEKIVKFFKDEYQDYLVYKKLAKMDKENRKILEKLAGREYQHYKFWKKFLKNKVEVKISNLYFYFLILLKLICGIQFLIKFLERNEKRIINEYKEFLRKLKGKDKEKLKKIIKDEELHENFLLSKLNDNFLKYSGFIVLGLADAIIEISGVHTGFLGLTSSTLIAGLAGLIVGFSASLSMVTAAYFQAKQNLEIDPRRAGILTGISYMLSVILLAIPYFLTSNMLIAYLFSITLAILMIACFNFYSSIVFEKSFLKEFIENVILIFTITFLSFLFGEFLSKYFKIQI